MWRAAFALSPEDIYFSTEQVRFADRLIALDQVIKYRGRYYGYYHALPAKGAWNTCVAVSDDLIHWRKYPRNPIVEGDRSSPVVVDDGRQYRLYTMHPDVRVYFPRDGAGKSPTAK